jgi:hypothetical protein
MKKILLSLICLTFFTGVFAQSLSLQDTNGVAIASGSVYYIWGEPTADIIQARINVKNETGAALQVKVKKVINAGDTLAGTMNYFCWGLCYGPDTYESPFPQTLEGGAVNEEFYGDYSPMQVLGLSRIKYVFFNVADRNDSVYVDVQFNASMASTGENLASLVKFSDAYPNPAVNRVNVDYSIPVSVKNASVVVTDLLGSRVKEISLEDLNGTARIQVSELTNGIYFYSLVADNKLIVTRKFMVKH